MIMSGYIGIGEKSQNVTELFVGIDGKAKKIANGWVGMHGKAQRFYSDEQEVLSLSVKADISFDKVSYFEFRVSGTDLQIDWGDGDSDLPGDVVGEPTTCTHRYENEGEYTITIFGYFSHLQFVSANLVEVLTPIPKNQIMSLEGCFQNMFSLRSIPADLFKNCSHVSNFDLCFYGCSDLIDIPSGLFAGCVLAERFVSCFQACTSLTSIPANLFASCNRACDFRYCFSECSDLTDIPDWLFAPAYEASFDGCFYGCASLEHLPSFLFGSSAISLKGCFENSGIKTIPENLFGPNDYYPSFKRCFADCRNLTEITEGLFLNCHSFDFEECFAGCIALTTLPREAIYLFYIPDFYGTQFNFNRTFKDCSSITEAVMELWEIEYSVNWLHDECFAGCLNAANYADIPSDWK